MLVSWCGHRHGYRNFDTRDVSTNALTVDFLVLGDMMQNNHHRHPIRTSNAVRRWFEIDPVGLVIRVFLLLRIVRPRPAPGEGLARSEASAMSAA